MPGSVANDIRYGARMLRRSPGFSAVAILSLGLGIGANTAIFSLIDQVLLKMLPVKEPERLVVFHWGGASFTYNQYRRLHDDARLFSGVLGYSPVRLNLSIGGELQPPGGGHLVTGNYFSILGVNAI